MKLNDVIENSEPSHSEPENENQDPVPVKLLPNATVTIRFDGLIVGAYDKTRRLFQTGVHTAAEGHHVVLTVTKKGEDKPFWPATDSDWDKSLATVRALAPFWMFVDSGNGLNDNDFDARLHNLNDENDVLSFAKVFSFERLYSRPLRVNRERVAEFNFPHGISYSALNTNAQLGRFDQNRPPSQATVIDDINVSTLIAIDIGAVSNDQSTQELVFASNRLSKEIFRLPLVAGTEYVIELLNQPIEQDQGQPAHHHHPVDHEQHFLQYYELFSLNEGEKKFLVQPAAPTTPPIFGTPQSPPCIGAAINTTGGLYNGS